MSASIQDTYLRDKCQAQRCAEERQKFKDNQQETKLVLERDHASGGQSQERYDKQTVQLKNNQSLDIITNQNLTHDTALLFRTQGQGVQDLLKMGLLRPDALTSKAI